MWFFETIFASQFWSLRCNLSMNSFQCWRNSYFICMNSFNMWRNSDWDRYSLTAWGHWWLPGHSDLLMSNNILVSLHEEITVILDPKKFPGWVAAVSIRPWELGMTYSFFRPSSLLDLTWTWSGPKAWQ